MKTHTLLVLFVVVSSLANSIISLVCHNLPIEFLETVATVNSSVGAVLQYRAYFALLYGSMKHHFKMLKVVILAGPVVDAAQFQSSDRKALYQV